MLTRQQYGGFTLIETVIVLMILGILAAVAAPSVSRTFSSQAVARAATVMAADVEASFALAARVRRPLVFTCDESTLTCDLRDQSTGAQRLRRVFDGTSGFPMTSMQWAPVASGAPVVIGPSGLATQGFSVTLGRGTSTRQIVVLRTGLTRIVP
jgi:prepilin-type N-terminal cleavage/methylation domain-containing protein